MKEPNITIQQIPITDLKPSPLNPRKLTADEERDLTESLKKFDFAEPLVVNNNPDRMNIVVGGNQRLSIAKKLGYETVPVVYLNLTEEQERELNLRLNRNLGEWDWDLLKQFNEDLLAGVGFSSEELDDIFSVEEIPEVFNLQKELEKLNIEKIEMQKGEVWQLGPHKLMVGDSCIEADILKLMKGEKAHMCLTDPPYILDYLKGKKKHKSTEGFGYKRDRRYLETDVIPPDFTEKWMANVHNVQHPNFSIIVYENWKNLRTIWGEMEKHWRVKNMIVWHLENRHQGFSARYKFFSKHDIAMVGVSGEGGEEKEKELNIEPEDELLQNEYETALYAISGKPQWEGYEKGKKVQPSDHITFRASDEKHSGQGIVFGCKPVEILIPYIKVLTKRDDLVIEPFGGSGSTLIACEKLKRRCNIIEKSPVYAEVIRHRWEKLTGEKGVKIKEKAEKS